MWKKLFERSSAVPAAPTDAAAEPAAKSPAELRDAAEQALEHGNGIEAHRLAAAALSASPGDVAAALIVEEAAFRRNHFGPAIAALQAATSAAPDHAELWMRLGVVLEADGKLAAARDAYQRCRTLDPTHAKAHCNYGAIQKRFGDLDGAIAAFVEAERHAPDLWQAWDNHGMCLKERGRVGAALEPYSRAVRLRRPLGPVRPECRRLVQGASRAKLDHDIEQLRYLRERGLVDPGVDPAIADLERARARFAAQVAEGGAGEFPEAMQGEAKTVYNRLLHVAEAPRLAGPAINPAVDFAAVEDDYFRNGPGITHVDQLLSPEALASLRRYCIESTLWFEYEFERGYVGASIEEGFLCPLLVQIAEELPRAMPRVIGRHPLTHLWAFKYDSQRRGIAEHADAAAVNVNFWLTPDDANLEPESGGLVVWDKEAPPEWDFATYNQDQERLRRFLVQSDAREVKIAHRQNRAVIFNSDLIHRTDDYHFRPGYENRRINVTLLYGYRQASERPAGS